MKKLESKEFRTHIPEPRWQQVVSVIVVVILIVLEIWAVRSN